MSEPRFVGDVIEEMFSINKRRRAMVRCALRNGLFDTFLRFTGTEEGMEDYRVLEKARNLDGSRRFPMVYGDIR